MINRLFFSFGFLFVSYIKPNHWISMKRHNLHYLDLRVCIKNRKNIPSNLRYKSHQIQKVKCFSYRLAVVFAQSIEARRSVENDDVVGAATTGDAPTTSDWSTILVAIRMRLILEVYGIVNYLADVPLNKASSPNAFARCLIFRRSMRHLFVDFADKL